MKHLEPQKPNILIADDHALFRDALLAYINRAEPDARVTAVQDLYQAQDQLSMSAYDIAILDWQMPGVHSLNDLLGMPEQHPATRFALMSGVIDQDEAKRILGGNFWGYFPKTLSGRALLEGIQMIIRGEKFIPYVQGSNALQPSFSADQMFYRPKPVILSERVEIKGIKDLTLRERDVLERLVRGMNNAEIADDIGVKLVTVKLHLRNACQKMGARNRTDAAMKCKAAGLFVS